MFGRRSFWIALTLVCVWLVVPAPAQGATIVVTNTASGTGGAGDCTLAEAIQAANTDTAVDGCVAGSGPDVITLGNCTITLLAPFQTDATDGPIGLPTSGASPHYGGQQGSRADL